MRSAVLGTLDHSVAQGTDLEGGVEKYFTVCWRVRNEVANSCDMAQRVGAQTVHQSPGSQLQHSLTRKAVLSANSEH